MNGTVQSMEKFGLTVTDKRNEAFKDHKDTDYMAFERVHESANYLLERTKYRPEISIICGSGLAGLGDLLDQPDIFEYEDIPNFPASTVPGHKSRLLFGRLKDVDVMLMQGRFHAYEGYPIQLCGMPVRVMKVCGVKKVIVTNAAGGLTADFNVGDIMMLKDHINLPGFTGSHPLKGPNDTRFGGRFFAVNRCYNKEFRVLARKVAEETAMADRLHEGVYVMLGGPNFETVAELKMLKTCGVDAVGMSTIPEVLVATHCGMKVFAFSLITNKCILEEEADHEANHEEVIKTGAQRQQELGKFVSNMVVGMSTIE